MVFACLAFPSTMRMMSRSLALVLPKCRTGAVSVARRQHGLSLGSMPFLLLFPFCLEGITLNFRDRLVFVPGSVVAVSDGVRDGNHHYRVVCKATPIIIEEREHGAL